MTQQMIQAPPKKEAKTPVEWNAVITGASSGIGSAIATAIAGTGAAVGLVGRNSERLESVATKARSTSRSVLICETDLSADSAIEELALRLRQEFKVIDVLVHCAGIFETGKLASSPIQRLDALYKMNVRMPIALNSSVAAVAQNSLRSDRVHKLFAGIGNQKHGLELWFLFINPARTQGPC